MKARGYLCALWLLAAGFTVEARDILRSGGSAGTPPATGGGTGSEAGGATALQAGAGGQDRLARTAQALQSVQAMQAAARKLALAGPDNLGPDPNHPGVALPAVPNGLTPGGLQVDPGVPLNPALWQGAGLPQQSTTTDHTQVTITQTAPQAILNWLTFNIGKNTKLTFDQSAGGANESQWTAFNKVNDPSGVPSQILGSIEAPGQVYVINQNGILFGGSSQINLHTLVASSLPINDNLIARGLLNNPDNQFLFSALKLDAGINGTPAFNPAPPSTPNGHSGDVEVQEGAVISTPTTPDHVGGRVALIGANVVNDGTISTPDGQTILAAGLQVGMAAHSTTDPSLRGLDVYVGSVVDPAVNPAVDPPYAGTASNRGLIDAPRANVTMAGKTVNQSGFINSTTSVALNGRIDLIADYNAASSGGFSDLPPFFPRNTGLVTLGSDSVTQILPELDSADRVVGTQLALQSQVNIRGQAIHLEPDALVLAPSANVALNAGVWNLSFLGSQSAQDQFVHASGIGQIYFDPGAAIDVAGSAGVTAPVSENIVEVQLRGTELADSPLLRNGPLRGKTILVDLRETGTYNGRVWVGTPLADASGYIGLVQRSVGELTTSGGTVKLDAGDSVVMQPGSSVNVSGGWINYQGGAVQTTQLVSGGHLYDISQATPDRVYGLSQSSFKQDHAKWGVTETFTHPLMTGTHSHDEPGYIQGGNGGSIAITAPSMALDGDLSGNTVAGPQQRTSMPAPGSLALVFQSQDPSPPLFLPNSPTPPSIVFKTDSGLAPADPFALDASGNPLPLRADRRTDVILSPDLVSRDGFGALKIDNSDGSISVPENVALNGPAGGSINLAAANIDIEGQVSAAGGSLSFSAFDFSPFAISTLLATPGSQTPPPDSTRGHFTLGPAASLNTAGLIVDDRPIAPMPESLPLATRGGTVTIKSHSAELDPGSMIDVSGGVAIGANGKKSYGDAGSVDIEAGQDPNLPSILGGHLDMHASLEGLSGAKGGSLSILAPLIQVGGATTNSDTLLLSPDFFSEGGFSSFTLLGLGAATGQAADPYLPGVVIAPGTVIAPLAQSLVAVLDATGGGDTMLTPTLPPQGLRTPVSLNFTAVGVRDPFLTDPLVVRGDFVMGAGAVIQTDPKGTVSISGDTVTVMGSIAAPGGAINVSGGKNSPALFPNQAGALPTVDLGPNSVLSAAGTTVLTPDPRGFRTGSVLPGGNISVSGNIAAEAGARLDVSGASDVLDLPPTFGSVDAGLGGSTTGSAVVPTRIDSNGGSITLAGGQELFTDATLMGGAGGPAARGGSLSVSSGRFYAPNTGASSKSPLDVTMVVTQDGPTIPASFHPAGQTAIGNAVLDTGGNAIPGLGHFAADSFASGGFESLALHGTVQFSGPVSISASRSITVGDSGIVYGDSAVSLNAPYVALGKPFEAPLQPQQLESPFRDGANQPIHVAPAYGAGSLTVTAGLIDVGNLSLQNIGKANLIADNGDIRGDGTFDVAGDISMRAGQIYPPTEVRFDVAAYDYLSGGITHPGSVTIAASGSRPLPLSAGGQLNIHGSIINQGGVLRAPIGAINLGWDGTGPAPADLLTGGTFPVSQQVTLSAGSITSVSAIDPVSQQALIIPYGINLNGTSWIDPTGADITGGGAPGKSIHISGLAIADQPGALIDISGGGDLYSYRWVPGVGGTRDILASSSSFAVIPGYQADYAPYAPYNSSAIPTNLVGSDPGYVNNGLSVGDRVFLGESKGLAAGIYTLLPARYALLPGAFLVTPNSGTPVGTTSLPDGSSLVSGYRFNDLNTASTEQPLISRFEIAPPSVVRSRAQYDDFFANSFLSQSAIAHDSVAANLPIDSGQMVLAATQAMTLQGSVAARAPAGGRGGEVDISSPVDILIAGPGATGGAGVLVLDSSELSAFGAESLLIGGVRQTDAHGTTVTVNTGNLTVDNAGSPLTGSEIILAANHNLALAPFADIEQTGALSGPAATLLLGDPTVPGSGDGALLRVSSDPLAQISRSGVSLSAVPTMVIRWGTLVSGASVTLDSTYATKLDPSAHLTGNSIALDSGQISLELAHPGTPQSTVGLVLSGPALQHLQDAAQSLSLLSYSSIDIYGTGQVGTLDATGEPMVESLALHTAEIRGFNNGGGTVSFAARNIILDNSPNGTTLGPITLPSGTLAFNAGSIQLGAHQLNVDQYANLALNASGGILARDSGGLAAQGALSMTTPLITGTAAANQTITAAGGGLTIAASANPAVSPVMDGGGLGARLTLVGASITDNSNIVLPSGALTLHATGGDVQIGNLAASRLDVSGTARNFYDLVKYTDGGQISLISDTGSVNLVADGTLAVAATTGGGNAGGLLVSAPQGVFTTDGAMLGQGGTGGQSGTFSLDAGTIPGGSLASLNAALNTGGFEQSRSIRVRTGDVLVDGLATSRAFRLSADQGSITVAGTIDASGTEGGSIDIDAFGSVTLLPGSQLTVAGQHFNAAGKGGSVSLEAGAETNGGSNGSALVDIQTGSTIDLSVADNTATSAAAGDLTGTLHVRAPQTAGNTDLQVNPINGTIVDASSIVVEGYKIFDLSAPAGATITSAIKSNVLTDGTTFAGNTAAMISRLLVGNGVLSSVLHIRPGAEVINTSGDLTLDQDWDLSTYRFGPNNDEPGVLTLRAAGNLNFNYNASLKKFASLSDGFTGPDWQATLLPAGAQSWSYRLVAGADFSAADFRQVVPLESPGLAANQGSLLLGKNAGAKGPIQTSNQPRQNIVPGYFQVIRTGTGDIDISTARDVQLLSPLSAIYTAGTQASALPNFDLPNTAYPTGTVLGGVQYLSPYPAQYSMDGGNVTISAQNNIARYSVNGFGVTSPDSSKELPVNWLYRRGYVDPATGQFAITHNGGEVASTSWWVDFSNFFEGVGALGGGDVTMIAGHDVSNVDGLVPTNARMPKGIPNSNSLVELGGGNLTVRAGNDIDGGVYYVEHGQGTLSADNSINTDSTRAALTQGVITADQIAHIVPDPTTWLPTTLFLGKGSFDVAARGDLLLGPVANPFLLPQGVNNSFFEKSYFSTYATSDAVNVSSLTGAVTLRDNAINGDGPTGSLASWFQNVFLLNQNPDSFASKSQPWLRLVETRITPFSTVEALMPATLRATAFSSDIDIVGNLTLSPSPTGTIDLAAAGSVNGMQINGLDGITHVSQWGSSSINLSDADPNRVPGIASPLSLAYLGPAASVLAEKAAWSNPRAEVLNSIMGGIDVLFDESGATQGTHGVLQTKQALHAPGPLHENDPIPVHVYAQSGDISGITLFSGKSARVVAGHDITDIALYLQNTRGSDISLVAAGRDIVAYDPNSPLRVTAQSSGNELLLSQAGSPTAGDIQISGPGTLEVLAGRNFDTGVGPNTGDGTAVGITSIGNARNPYLPFGGADIIVGAGIGGSTGLEQSKLDFTSFIAKFLNPASEVRYLPELGAMLSLPSDADPQQIWAAFSQLPADQQDRLALDIFYLVLRDAGRDHNQPAAPGFGNYDAAFSAIGALFPGNSWQGDISLTSREVKTASGGNIDLFAPGGQLTVGFDLGGNQPVDQGILTEDGGNISIFTRDNVNVGTSRIFTLRGGNEIIFSSKGSIAAGASSKTVQSAPPTRVLIDPQSGDVKTDLAGLATGGGIGVLATVTGVPPGDVDLIAPAGTIDAGDAGIRVSGNINISAVQVLNVSNIQAGGASTGVPVVAPSSNLSGLQAAAASTSAAATTSTADEVGKQQEHDPMTPHEPLPSMITVEVLGYGGGEGDVTWLQ